MEMMPDDGYYFSAPPRPNVLQHKKHFAWKPIICKYKGKTELRWLCWVWRQEEWHSSLYMIAVRGYLTDQQYLRYKLAAN